MFYFFRLPRVDLFLLSAIAGMNAIMIIHID
ncbi:hypothetical protein EMIT0347P_20549 [Pseudomonas sp. IT-347P]